MTQQKHQERFVFVKDAGRSKCGYACHDEAVKCAATIKEDAGTRVRVRMRSRTGLWDVLVKTAKKVEA